MSAAVVTKRFLWAGVLLSGVLAGVLYVALGRGPDTATAMKELAQRCPQTPDPMTCVIDIGVSVYREKGPADVFAALTTLHDDPSSEAVELRHYCHDMLHEIGLLEGAERGLQAVMPGASMCEGGYYHGVYRGLPSEERANLTNEACLPLQEEDRRNCLHGYGHAQYVTEGVAVLDPRCGDEPVAAAPCLDGYFMEFGAVNDHKLEHLDLCRTQPQNAQESCARQLGGTTANKHPEEVARWCDLLNREGESEAMVRACWHGVGAAVSWVYGEAVYDLSQWREVIPSLCAEAPDCWVRSLEVYGQRHNLAEILSESQRLQEQA